MIWMLILCSVLCQASLRSVTVSTGNVVPCVFCSSPDDRGQPELSQREHGAGGAAEFRATCEPEPSGRGEAVLSRAAATAEQEPLLLSGGAGLVFLFAGTRALAECLQAMLSIFPFLPGKAAWPNVPANQRSV